MQPDEISPEWLLAAFKSLADHSISRTMIERCDSVVLALQSEECSPSNLLFIAMLSHLPPLLKHNVTLSTGILLGLEMAAAREEITQLEEMIS